VPLSVAAIAIVIVGLVLVLRNFLAKPVQPQKQVATEIRIVRPPPPPPEVKPPPPPPPEEKVDLPEPQPTPIDDSNEPPPGEQLGVDATGTGGGDAFGLVGRPGGRDLLATGGGGAFTFYASLVKNEILDSLGNEPRARKGSYSVNVRLWVRRDGTVERAELMGTSGNAERDEAIRSALSRMSKISQAPPVEMPQPISLRIVSRT
jgi:protein TonB